jgi:hypothetical protein
MPSAERRAARTNRLIRDYKTARKAFEKRLHHRKARLRRSFRLAKAQGLHHSKASLESLSELSEISPLSAMSEGDSESDASNSGDYDFNNSPTTSLFEDENHFVVPGLLPVGMDSDSDSQAASSSSDGEGSLVSDILDFNADDELEERDGEDLDEENQTANHNMLGKWDRLRRWVLNQIVGMYATRYELPWDRLPHGPSYLHHILTHLKTERDDHFCESLHVNPTTFDALITAIEDDPIFTNNSNNSQMAIEEQLAITLY